MHWKILQEYTAENSGSNSLKRCAPWFLVDEMARCSLRFTGCGKVADQELWLGGSIFAPSFCMDCSPRVIVVLPLCVIQGRDMPVRGILFFRFYIFMDGCHKGFPCSDKPFPCNESLLIKAVILLLSDLNAATNSQVFMEIKRWIRVEWWLILNLSTSNAFFMVWQCGSDL